MTQAAHLSQPRQFGIWCEEQPRNVRRWSSALQISEERLTALPIKLPDQRAFLTGSSLLDRQRKLINAGLTPSVLTHVRFLNLGFANYRGE